MPFHSLSRKATVHALALLLLTPPLVASCGGGKPEPAPTPAPPAGGSGSGVVRIGSGARLGWTQAGPSLADVQAYTYILYIDGGRDALREIQCAGGGGAFDCSGRLPPMTAGRTYVLELAAIANGGESARSAPLRVEVMASTTSLDLSGLPAPAAVSSTCVGDARRCYDVHQIALSAESMTWPVATPEGRLFVVEGGRSVRAVEGSDLTPDPALVLESPSARIVGLALGARHYAQTRTLFVAWIDDDRNGERQLHITRFRDVDGRLGEPATIVTGIAVPEAEVPIAVTEEAILYVALPAFANGGAASADRSYAGMVLRFTADGAVPRTNPTASPVVAIGFERPTGIAADASGRVWLGGSREGWTQSVLTIASTDPMKSRATWPDLPHAPSVDQTWGPRPLLTMAPGDDSASGARLHVIASGELHEVIFHRDGMSARRVQFEGIGGLVGLASSVGGDRYLVTRSDVDGQTRLLRLIPR